MAALVSVAAIAGTGGGLWQQFPIEAPRLSRITGFAALVAAEAVTTGGGAAYAVKLPRDLMPAG